MIVKTKESYEINIITKKHTWQVFVNWLEANLDLKNIDNNPKEVMDLYYAIHKNN